MKGWGKQHRPDIISASEATGLRQSQIEVGVAAYKTGIQPHDQAIFKYWIFTCGARLDMQTRPIARCCLTEQ